MPTIDALKLLCFSSSQTIMLDDGRSRQDGVGGSKGPGSVHEYPQTDGYNVGTMAK